MPLVDVQLVEGVFDKGQKQAMIAKITDAMVEIEGEAMRGVTWVRVHEVASGHWGIGGKALTSSWCRAPAVRRAIGTPPLPWRRLCPAGTSSVQTVHPG